MSVFVFGLQLGLSGTFRNETLGVHLCVTRIDTVVKVNLSLSVKTQQYIQ